MQITKGRALRFLNKYESAWKFVYKPKNNVLTMREKIIKGPGLKRLIERADKIFLNRDSVPIITIYKGETEYILIITRTKQNICSIFR